MTMSERYERSNGPAETVTCEGRYTNYRRFEVRIRVN
jgi:hypothetical protein